MKNNLRKTPVKCIIFDLDGTLVDTIDDLGLACDYLLRQEGITPHWTKNDYKKFVGNGAKLLVQRAFSNQLSEEDLNFQYELFKVKYRETMLDHAYVYDGMAEVVEVLKEKGVKLAVCTNKPNAAAVGIVEHFFGSETFDIIRGAFDGKPKKPDPTIAYEIANTLDVKANECLWIGDSTVDIESAKNFGCECAAVTWGFRSRKCLLECDPEYIIDAPKDILKILNFLY